MDNLLELIKRLEYDEWLVLLFAIAILFMILGKIFPSFSKLFCHNNEEFSSEECNIVLTFNDDTTQTINISEDLTELNNGSFKLVKSIDFNNTGPIEMTVINSNNTERTFVFSGYTNVTASKLEEDNMLNNNEVYTGYNYRIEDNDLIHQGLIKLFKCKSIIIHRCRLHD